VVVQAGRRGGRLGAREAAACRRGALGGDSEVGPRPRQSADGGGGGGLTRSHRFLAPRQRGKEWRWEKIGARRTVDGRTRGGGVFGQCMVRQEEVGSDRWQARGHGGGGIRSVRQGTAAHGPTGRSGGGT
jgi:hypothetical protein